MIRLSAAIVGACCLIVATSTRADLFIDTFEVPHDLSANSTFTPISGGTFSGPGILGFNRVVAAGVLSPTGAVRSQANQDLAGVWRTTSSSTTTEGFSNVSYTTLADFDVSDGGVLEGYGINVTYNATPVFMKIVVADTSSHVQTLDIEIPVLMSGPSQIFVAFDEFPLVDRAHMRDVSFNMHPLGPNVDIRIESLELVVPEPSTAILLSLCAVLSFRRGRRHI